MNLMIPKVITKKEIVTDDKGHAERVAAMSSKLAAKMGLTKDTIDDIYIAALNHDAGKAYITDEVLNKPEKLEKTEYELVKYHVLFSAALAIEKFYNENVIRYIYFHHENFNGSGYPCGLVGLTIPIGARIIRIADFYDALTNNRVYRKKKYSQNEAVEIMKNNSHLLDPDISQVFYELLGDNSHETYIKNNMLEALATN